MFDFNWKPTLLAAAAALAISAPAAHAQQFAEGSKAKEFGLLGAEKARFTGKVVDVLCELAGDCADNCGNGNRPLGILRDADGKLVFVLKNGQFQFNGPVEDLVPYCQKAVEVDGVLIGDDEAVKTKFYMVQVIKEVGAEKFSKANLWTKAWAKRNPDVAEGKGPWFRRDPRVLKQIEANGHFGLGHDEDKKYIAENE